MLPHANERETQPEDQLLGRSEDGLCVDFVLKLFDVVGRALRVYHLAAQVIWSEVGIPQGHLQIGVA